MGKRKLQPAKRSKPIAMPRPDPEAPVWFLSVGVLAAVQADAPEEVQKRFAAALKDEAFEKVCRRLGLLHLKWKYGEIEKQGSRSHVVQRPGLIDPRTGRPFRKS